jgi:transposase
MRKGFNGLFGLLRDRLQCEPLSGHVFLFCNGQRNRLKLVYSDGSGLWVCAKRLEEGKFRWPEVTGDQNRVQLSHEELAAAVGRDRSAAGRTAACWRGVAEEPAA